MPLSVFSLKEISTLCGIKFHSTTSAHSSANCMKTNLICSFGAGAPCMPMRLKLKNSTEIERAIFGLIKFLE